MDRGQRRAAADSAEGARSITGAAAALGTPTAARTGPRATRRRSAAPSRPASIPTPRA